MIIMQVTDQSQVCIIRDGRGNWSTIYVADENLMTRGPNDNWKGIDVGNYW